MQKKKKTEDCKGKLSIDQENGGAVIRRERGEREKKKKNSFSLYLSNLILKIQNVGFVQHICW